MATHPARLPKPQPNNINHKDSRYERGTTGGQVKGMANVRKGPGASIGP
jgi:hypothetical protein